MWEQTQHKERKALVEELTKTATARAVRGDFVWTVFDSDLIAIRIRKDSNGLWEYCKLPESEFTHEMTSCPKSYLNKTTEVNMNWRNNLLQFLGGKKGLKQKVSDLFAEAQASKKRLIIEVETETRGLFVLEVEAAVPLSGRHQNGKLYKIPLRRIARWYMK